MTKDTHTLGGSATSVLRRRGDRTISYRAIVYLIDNFPSPAIAPHYKAVKRLVAKVKHSKPQPR